MTTPNVTLIPQGPYGPALSLREVGCLGDTQWGGCLCFRIPRTSGSWQRGRPTIDMGRVVRDAPESVQKPLPGVLTPTDPGSAVTHSTVGQRGAISCSGCDTTWTALNAAHCSVCHCTFSAVGLFDAHRSPRGEHGACLYPAEVTTGSGARRMFFRDGMWRCPEMSEDQKAKRGWSS